MKELIATALMGNVWVSAKFTGPKYGFPSADGKSEIRVDRVVLVKPED